MRNRKRTGWERYKKKSLMSNETMQKRRLDWGERREVRGRENDGGEAGGGGMTKWRKSLKGKNRRECNGGWNGIGVWGTGVTRSVPSSPSIFWFTPTLIKKKTKFSSYTV
jgi:hypothetical protein